MAAIPFVMDASPPASAAPDKLAADKHRIRALVGWRADQDDKAATIDRYRRKDGAATAALNLTTTQTTLRTVTGRADDVLVSAAVMRPAVGSGSIVLCVGRRVADGRTFRAALTGP
jgi:hypothetical protein